MMWWDTLHDVVGYFHDVVGYFHDMVGYSP